MAALFNTHHPGFAAVFVEDFTALIGPDQYREFFLEHDRRILEQLDSATPFSSTTTTVGCADSTSSRHGARIEQARWDFDPRRFREDASLVAKYKIVYYLVEFGR